MASPQSPALELKSQLQNPGDIFSLLLLVGGDVVQKAVAQLVGVRFKLSQRGPTVHLTPAVFSFGWVAYAFTSLAAALGDHRLMPAPDTDVQVINCENGYTRANNAWILGRLLRDHESRVENLESTENAPTGSTGKVSLLIDVLVAEKINKQGPPPSTTWWLSWLLILVQIIVASIPWIKWGYWPVFMVTICGTLLAMVTAALPQWAAEKWPADQLHVKKVKPVAITRGNGSRYVMLILSHDGSWDLESMASGRLNGSPSTKPILAFITLLWILLLLAVTGMKQYTWFLIAVGGSGSIWQTYVAAKPTRSEDVNISLKPWDERETIVGYQYMSDTKKDLKENFWKEYSDADAEREFQKRNQYSDVRDVMGTLMELEKYLPKAGAALLSVFFPGNVDYEPNSLHNSREKKFWMYAKTAAPK